MRTKKKEKTDNEKNEWRFIFLLYYFSITRAADAYREDGCVASV